MRSARGSAFWGAFALACGPGSTASVPLQKHTSAAAGDAVAPSECPGPIAHTDHLSIGWTGGDCTVEVGPGVEASSLEMRVDPAPDNDIASANGPIRAALGTTVHSCGTLASNWPDKPGAYDVMIRNAVTGQQVTKRIWIDAHAGKRELQRSTMTLRDVYKATVLLHDGTGLFVARVGSAPDFSDAFTGPNDYGSRAIYNQLDPEDVVGCGLLPAISWEAVSGAFAGLAPSASRVGDQLVLNGLARRWTVRSVAEEATLASWAPPMFVEDSVDPANEARFGALLSGKGALRRVSLSQSGDCGWAERQDWTLDVPGERVLTAGSFNARGQAGVIAITATGGAHSRFSVQVGEDSGGTPVLSAPHELPEGLSLPEHTGAGVRVEKDGIVRGAFIGHLPETGWSLFEAIAQQGKLVVERTTLPLQSIVVGRVDYDGDEPMWVVRTSDGEIGSGHGGGFDEACPVGVIVPGAPFMGGGTIAWQRAPGADVHIGLCQWRPIERTMRASPGASVFTPK